MLEFYSITADRELSPCEFDALAERVTPDRAERARKKRNISDAVNSLLSELIVRFAVQRRTGETDISFAAGEFGKLYIVGSGLEFSVSHSGDMVVCALDSEPLGVDIEMIVAPRIAVARRYFRDDEYAAVRADETAFYRIWTMKESYIKRDGRGLGIPLNSFSVFETERHGLRFHFVDVRDNACCCVCTAREEIRSVGRYKLSELQPRLNGYRTSRTE